MPKHFNTFAWYWTRFWENLFQNLLKYFWNGAALTRWIFGLGMGVDWISNKQTTFVVNKQSTFTVARFHHHVWVYLVVLVFLPGPRGTFKSVICSTANELFQEISQDSPQAFEKKHCKSLAVGLSGKMPKVKREIFVLYEYCREWKCRNVERYFCENIPWIPSSLAAVRTPSSWLGILMFMNKREKMWDELKQWKGLFAWQS